MLREGTVSYMSAGWMPASLATLLSSGMIISYIWALVRKDVAPFLPFISDAGGNPPQSGIFAIFLFASAVMGLLTILTRYVVMYQETYRLGRRWLKYLNHASIFVGFICLDGMVVVAAYPIHSSKLLSPNETFTDGGSEQEEWKRYVMLPHTMGAFLCFTVGLLYAVFQSVLSYFIKPVMNSDFWQGKHLHLLTTRVVCCVIAFISIILMSVYRGKRKGPDMWRSTPASRVQAVAEWILALMLVLLFLSLYPEMKTIQIEVSAHAPSCDTVSQSQMTIGDGDHSTSISQGSRHELAHYGSTSDRNLYV